MSRLKYVAGIFFLLIMMSLEYLLDKGDDLKVCGVKGRRRRRSDEEEDTIRRVYMVCVFINS